jgi:uncharacterized protein
VTQLRAALTATILVLCALFAGPQAWAQDSTALNFPKLTGRVVDAAKIIPDAEEAQLTQKLEALEKQSHRQLVVATVPSLNGYEISDYSNQLFRTWKLGDKERNDGVLLVVAPNERKVRIEVGYGMEPIITDGLSFLVTNNAILPRFKAGDVPGGIEAGVDALIKQLTLPPEEARKIAAEADKQRADGSDDISLSTVIFILVVIFFFVLPILRSTMGGGRRSSGFGSPIIWMPGGFGGDDDDRGGGGFGGGWGGGGFGGGGGFSGGGGSSGGGGASGSW